jgi:hypothetical protein
MMVQSLLDIFRVESQGVRWLESSASPDEANARIQQLGVRISGEYVVLNHATGAKLVIKIDVGGRVAGN